MEGKTLHTQGAECAGVLTCEMRGRMVVPACPPTTGTSTSRTSKPLASATKQLARTTSSVETPRSLLGLYTPAALSTSAAMGTVELTGLEMMLRMACGAGQAQAT